MVMAGRLRFYPSRLPIQSFRPWTDVLWHSPRVPRFIGCGLFLERTEFVWTCGSKEKQRYRFQHLWRQIVLTTVFATLSGFSDNALLSCEHSAKFGTVTLWSSHCEMRLRNVRPVGVSFPNWKHSGQGMTKQHVWQYRTIQDLTGPKFWDVRISQVQRQIIFWFLSRWAELLLFMRSPILVISGRNLAAHPAPLWHTDSVCWQLLVTSTWGWVMHPRCQPSPIISHNL